MRSSALTTVAFSALAAATDIHVTVGADNQFRFVPEDFTAEVGDNVIFHFEPKNHAVVTADFAAPCKPSTGDGGFYSDFHPTASGEANVTFVVQIQDTKPKWLYCPQTTGSHCQSGMVAAINAPANKTLEQFRAAAANAPPSTHPDAAFGGTLVPTNSTSNSTDGSSDSGSGSDINNAGSGSGSSSSWDSGSSSTDAGSSATDSAGSSATGSAGASATTGSGKGNSTSTGSGSSPITTGGASAIGSMAPVALAVSLFVALLS